MLQVANKICPRCHNANYVRYLGELSDSYKYKCINCNAYLNDEDFEKPVLNNSENNKKMNSGGVVSWDFIDKIYIQMRETEEDFVFSTISPYITDTTQIIVSKELLIRAITEYFKNHPEEQQNAIN